MSRRRTTLKEQKLFRSRTMRAFQAILNEKDDEKRDCARNSQTEDAARGFFEHCVQDPPHSVFL